MLISSSQYMIRSQNANNVYWEQGLYPDWTSVSAYRHFPNGAPGTGVEPHYHDNDEMWLFTDGAGEVWLDDQRYDITPNTMVYTPMGCVHRFQMFTPYENNAIVTPLEGKMRPIHITVEDYGPPVATAPGFVIKGTQNIGPFPDPGDRCPLSEWRMVRLDAGDRIDESTLFSNEHWLVITGSVLLGIDGREIELTAHDVALLRTGIPRGLYTRDGARMIVARERCNEL